MAAGMIQETGQDGGLKIYNPYIRPSLIQALFGRMSTEVNVAFSLAVFLVYIIMAAQFESFLHPFDKIAQELQHKTGAVNIEVPVRVFKGGTFIDNLIIYPMFLLSSL